MSLKPLCNHKKSQLTSPDRKKKRTKRHFQVGILGCKSRSRENSLVEFCISALLKVFLRVKEVDFQRFL